MYVYNGSVEKTEFLAQKKQKGDTGEDQLAARIQRIQRVVTRPQCLWCMVDGGYYQSTSSAMYKLVIIELIITFGYDESITL